MAILSTATAITGLKIQLGRQWVTLNPLLKCLCTMMPPHVSAWILTAITTAQTADFSLPIYFVQFHI